MAPTCAFRPQGDFQILEFSTAEGLGSSFRPVCSLCSPHPFSLAICHNCSWQHLHPISLSYESCLFLVGFWALVCIFLTLGTSSPAQYSAQFPELTVAVAAVAACLTDWWFKDFQDAYIIKGPIIKKSALSMMLIKISCIILWSCITSLAQNKKSLVTYLYHFPKRFCFPFCSPIQHHNTW